MKIAIQEFIDYLHREKKTSQNTEVSYKRDLKKMEEFLTQQGVEREDQVSPLLLNSYVLYLENSRLAPASISRNVASVRAFFRFLYKNRVIDEDPSEHLKAPKIEKKMPEILSVEEVEVLLQQPDVHTAKGMRDRAMIELLYATGMRVSELIRLRAEDVNLSLGYVTCCDGERERIIPFGRICQDALQEYLSKARESFVRERQVEELFTNCSGRPMSRQGFWKVLKTYARQAGITRDITPHTLRHSFAAHLIQNGAEVKSVQEMLGPSDVSTTQRYLNLNVNKIRDVYMNAHPRH